MPIIKVYGIPASVAGSPKQRERSLKRLTTKLQKAVAGVNELQLNPDHISVFYPADLMHTGIGEEIIVEVTGLFRKPARTHGARAKAADSLKEVVREHFRGLSQLKLIEVFVHSFDPTEDGFAEWKHEASS